MMRRVLTILPLVMILEACGVSIPPKDLVDARATYKRAEEGPAGTLQPAELHTAKTALDEAEAAYAKDEKSPKTLDLAYVALRKAEWAEAVGAMAADQKRKVAAEAEATKLQKEYIARTEKELGKTKGELGKTKEDLGKTKEDLGKTKADLGKASGELGKTKEELAAEKKKLEEEKAARIAAEKKAQEAKDALAKIMAVKEESRGTVITLSGSVLFASGEYKLLPSAQESLNRVADALKNMAEHTFVIEGHTDNVGKDSVNQELSRKRAEAVRDYLVVRGVPADMIKAVGKGSAVPVADNKTAEGRANNRRVEIIVQPEGKK
ncbi:MAG: OmpA family protein [Deltaproteobacteria bacterium]|nr:OmpA family protein [Deltaproteobacteria bacterium]